MLEHFEKRIEWHSRTYEPISESTFPHVQMLNLGQRIVVNNVMATYKTVWCSFS